MMETLLQLSLDIDDFDDASGFRASGTPWYSAIRERMTEKVKILLTKGSDVKIAGRRGVTPKELAKQTAEKLVALVEIDLRKRRAGCVRLLSNARDDDSNGLTWYLDEI